MDDQTKGPADLTRYDLRLDRQTIRDLAAIAERAGCGIGSVICAYCQRGIASELHSTAVFRLRLSVMSAKMADQIKAAISALTVMEYDLRKASAAADLLRGCSETPMRLITYRGRTQNLRAWAKEIGVKPARGFGHVLPRDGRSNRRSPPASESYSKGSRRLPRWLGKRVSQRGWRSTGGRSAIQWKRFCSQVPYHITTYAFSHLTARQRA